VLLFPVSVCLCPPGQNSGISNTKIREQLEDYPAERIYNMDETGLFYRCIPNRAYVQAGQRRQVRGTKAMKAKDRVTIMLASNAPGSHKIPVALIGKAKQPKCFKPPRDPCPMPYFSQPSAWMDADVFKSWFETVFVPAVRARTALPVALISDNCGAHEELESTQVSFFSLPPYCKSVYQPLDLEIIACLKRRYKRRLLNLVVGAFASPLGDRADVSSAPAARPESLGAPEARPPTLGSRAGASPGGVPADAVLSGPATGTLSGAAPPMVASTAPGAASDATCAGEWLSADGWWTDSGDVAN